MAGETSGKRSANQRLQIGIPACDELDWLPETLGDLAVQTDLGFEVWVCVNHSPNLDFAGQGAEVVLRNQATLAMLKLAQKEMPFALHILDGTGPNGPPSAIAGVGWARRLLFDSILNERGEAVVAISLDADTRVGPSYLADLRSAFKRFPKAIACAIPYYHELPDQPQQALQLLRYEIYLRYYHVNLWRIGSPYALTALGSALAFRGAAYRRVGGFTTRKAGEDFYLLQQLRKMGPVITWLPSRVQPASRVSHRVPFGTGILLAADAMPIIQTRFPFYHMEDFDRIEATYGQWPQLYKQAVPLPIQDFLDEKLGGMAPFDRMRRNVTSALAFVRACHGRLDGLKLVQCLRYYRARSGDSPPAEEQLGRLLASLGAPEKAVPFHSKHLADLIRIRERLWQLESQFQRAYMQNWERLSTW